ncbi:MAG: regulatory protein RecX [Oceanicoccus sp.]
MKISLNIRRAAMDLLARREHAFHELVSKLSRKFSTFINSDDCPLSPEEFNDAIVEQIAVLTEENLQSDERFVESFINGRKAQGKGPLRIRQELEQRRVSPELIEDYLDEYNEHWQDLARQVYLKKYGPGDVATYQEKSKRLRFMHYRGFSPGIIYPLVNK